MSIAFALIQCDNLAVDNVIEQLKKIDSVKEIQGVFGIYDIIIKVQTKDTKTIPEIISTQIRKIDKLKSTLTLTISNPDGE
jgi:DNA-binding Lrp family transcriptional regulator